ncbi:MAG: PSD1 and planctomycete cytochrome C domain-containing protein [Planctomycetaceae bacterium]
MPSSPGLCVVVAVVAAVAHAADPVDFDRDVRPLFAAHCTACHGGVKQAGGLSLVSREQAVGGGESGAPALVPGDPDASELMRRVTTADAAERMPPPEHGRGLSPAEVATLRAWIAAGAGWRKHWSFAPPVDPPVPAVNDSTWPRVPFDGFVAARLAAEGLPAAPPARPHEWLRRVSLDLVGLPPTIEDYDAYLADGGGSGDPHAVQLAKERVVARLLAAPQFGERWAAVWLDLARYADTFGFEKDPTRTIWPWRDWVIRAFNDDMPFDQFTIRQLAGDLLPEPTTDDLLATAFHRNTQTNTEGGTDDEEYRMAAVMDRVNTTWTTWQATTFGCVQCHAHPYDPLPHEAYYRFMAYFNGTDDCDQNDEFPTLPVPPPGPACDAVSSLLRTLGAARRDLHALGSGVARVAAEWRPLDIRQATTTGGSLTVPRPGRIEAAGTLPVGVRYDLDAVLPAGTTAIRLTIDLESGGEEAAPPERGAVVSLFELRMPGAVSGRADVGQAVDQVLPIAAVVADSVEGPYDPRASLHKNPDGFGGFPTLDRPRWCIFVLAEPAGVPADGRVRVSITQSAASNVGTQACTLRRARLETSVDGRWTDMVRDDAWRRAADRVGSAESTLAGLAAPRVPVLAEQAAGARRITRVLVRGNRLDPAAAVMPGLPAAFAPPPDTPPDRLGMARWLVSETNPLTARVLANRLWAELFGTGIVETLEDFGSSGSRPSHPDLLDHLAVRLVRDHRWSMKRFLQEIAVSATYGQSAASAPGLLARDPRNRLLARGPRSRLTAEMVRDQALAWSGLLSGTMFGRPVFPPQPEGIWKTVYSGATWETSQGEDRYRRSIYTFVKRTAGYPAWLAFDAPSRDTCTARRIPTNTPLQPLATLNDPMMIELAGGLAARMASGGGSPRDRIAAGCRLVTLAQPPPGMVDHLTGVYEAAVRDHAGGDQAGEAADLAALQVVATAILNLDIALVR